MNKLLRSPEPQAGDIIGFSGYGRSSVFINLVTYGVPWWGLSHVGILGEHDGRLLLFESCHEDDDPCVIRNVRFSGTQAHELRPRLDAYYGRVWHYPLFRSLYGHERTRLNQFLLDTLGTPYDQIGAFRSGGLGYSWLESRMRDSDLSSIFCSEWCCSAHATIGVLTTDHVSRYSPNRFVRTERKQGILLAPRRLK